MKKISILVVILVIILISLFTFKSHKETPQVPVEPKIAAESVNENYDRNLKLMETPCFSDTGTMIDCKG